jgi:hypothetical protein
MRCSLAGAFCYLRLHTGFGTLESVSQETERDQTG